MLVTDGTVILLVVTYSSEGKTQTRTVLKQRVRENIWAKDR
jgi:hypothetical protein